MKTKKLINIKTLLVNFISMKSDYAKVIYLLLEEINYTSSYFPYKQKITAPCHLGKIEYRFVDY